jgi:hypothetical protein
MTTIDRESWKQLEPLLDRAIDMPPAERSQGLAELAAGSPAIAAQLVSLLAAEDEVEQGES